MISFKLTHENNVEEKETNLFAGFAANVLFAPQIYRNNEFNTTDST